MTAPPPCPPGQDFSVLSGFMTPHGLDASITMDVLDPTEGGQGIRVVATADPWALKVDWCVCGSVASMLSGCWYVQVFINEIDGVGPTSGLIGSAYVDLADGTLSTETEEDTTCFEYSFNLPAGSVQAGVYRLVVVITCTSGSCERPGSLLRDMCGYAEVPVLVFYQA